MRLAEVFASLWSYILLTCLLVLGACQVADAQTVQRSTLQQRGCGDVSPFSLVGMSWAPDGRLFVWQKNGVVRIIKNGALLPTPFIDLSGQVNGDVPPAVEIQRRLG